MLVTPPACRGWASPLATSVAELVVYVPVQDNQQLLHCPGIFNSQDPEWNKPLHHLIPARSEIRRRAALAINLRSGFCCSWLSCQLSKLLLAFLWSKQMPVRGTSYAHQTQGVWDPRIWSGLQRQMTNSVLSCLISGVRTDHKTRRVLVFENDLVKLSAGKDAWGEGVDLTVVANSLLLIKDK